MRILVDGQEVPEELIRQAEQWLAHDLRWQSIRDEAERARELHAAAEQAAIERVLVEQVAARDPRPIDPKLIEQEIQRQKGGAAGRATVFDDPRVRAALEQELRRQRTIHEMVAEAAKPSAEAVKAFYDDHRENFRTQTMFRAAHIVREVNESQSEEEAEAGIRAAQAELESGAPFGEVADRYSDCKGNGGDLGEFPAGEMVDDFEKAIDALEPGQRTGIFTTPFGFHIARLNRKTPAAVLSLAEVRQDIEGALGLQNQHPAYLRGVAKLRAKADIRFVP